MAFKTKIIIDLKGIIVLMLLTVGSKATNLDCYGKSFHCVNSTHFMICVDLGTGISTTIDDVIIPCPSTTVCSRTNRYECEFSRPPISSTTTVNTVTTETDVTSFTTLVTTSIPFEEYFDTVGTTALSKSVPRHLQDVVSSSTEKITRILSDTNTTAGLDHLTVKIANNTPNAKQSKNELNLTIIPHFASSSNTYKGVTLQTVEIKETTPFSSWNTDNIGTVSANVTSVLSENERNSEYAFSTEQGLTPEYTTEAVITTEAPITQYFIDEVSVVEYKSTKPFPYENATSIDYPSIKSDNYDTIEVTKKTNSIYTSSTTNLTQENIKAEVPDNTSFINSLSDVKQSVTFESNVADFLPRINDTTATPETTVIAEEKNKVNTSYTFNTTNLAKPIRNAEITNNITVIDDASIVDQSVNFQKNSTKALLYEIVTNIEHVTTMPETTVTADATKDPKISYAPNTIKIPNAFINAARPGNASFADDASVNVETIINVEVIKETNTTKKPEAINDATEQLIRFEPNATNDSLLNNDYSTSMLQTTGTVEETKEADTNYTPGTTNQTQVITNTEAYQETSNFSKSFPHDNATTANSTTKSIPEINIVELTKDEDTIYATNKTKLTNSNINPEISVDRSFIDDASVVGQLVYLKTKSAIDFPPKSNSNDVYSTTIPETTIIVEIIKETNTNYTSNTTNLTEAIINVDLPVDPVFVRASAVEQSIDYSTNTPESAVLVGITERVHNTEKTILTAEKPINASITHNASVIKPLVTVQLNSAFNAINTSNISNSDYNAIIYEAQKINDSIIKHDVTTNITAIVIDQQNINVTETHLLNKSYTDFGDELSTTGKLNKIRQTSETSDHIILVDAARINLDEKEINKNTEHNSSILTDTTLTIGQPKTTVINVDTIADKATLNFTETNVQRDTKTNKSKPNVFHIFVTKPTTIIENVNENVKSPSISTSSTELNTIKVANEIFHQYSNIESTIKPSYSFTPVEITTENALVPETLTKAKFESTTNDVLLTENANVVTDTILNINDFPTTYLKESSKNKTLAILDSSTSSTTASINLTEVLTTTSFDNIQMLPNAKTNQTLEETSGKKFHGPLKTAHRINNQTNKIAQDENFLSKIDVINIIPKKINSINSYNETSTTAAELLFKETTEFGIGEKSLSEVSGNPPKHYTTTLLTLPVRNESTLLLKGITLNQTNLDSNNKSTSTGKTQLAEDSPIPSAMTDIIQKNVTENTEKTVSIDRNQINITETEKIIIISTPTLIAEQNKIPFSDKVKIQSLDISTSDVIPVDISTSLLSTEIDNTKAADITSDYTLIETTSSSLYDTTSASHTDVVTEVSPEMLITTLNPEIILPIVDPAGKTSINIIVTDNFENSFRNEAKDNVTTEITPVTGADLKSTNKTIFSMADTNDHLRRSTDNSVSKNTYVNEATKQIPVTEKGFLASSTILLEDSNVNNQEMFLYTIATTDMITTKTASTITGNIISNANNINEVPVTTNSNFSNLDQIKNASHINLPVLSIKVDHPPEAVSIIGMQTEADKILTINKDRAITENASGDSIRNTVQISAKPDRLYFSTQLSTTEKLTTEFNSINLETQLSPNNQATIKPMTNNRMSMKAETTVIKTTENSLISLENSTNEKQTVEINQNLKHSLTLTVNKNESVSSTILTQIESNKQSFGNEDAVTILSDNIVTTIEQAINNNVKNNTEGVGIINYSVNQPLKDSRASTGDRTKDSSTTIRSDLDGIVTFAPGDKLTSNLQLISSAIRVTEPSNTLEVENPNKTAKSLSSSPSSLKTPATYSTTTSSLQKYDKFYTQKNSIISDNHNNVNDINTVLLQSTNKTPFPENLNDKKYVEILSDHISTSSTATHTENKNSTTTKPFNVEIKQTSAVTKPNELTVTKAINSHIMSGQTEAGRSPTVSKQEPYLSSTLKVIAKASIDSAYRDITSTVKNEPVIKEMSIANNLTTLKANINTNMNEEILTTTTYIVVQQSETAKNEVGLINSKVKLEKQTNVAGVQVKYHSEDNINPPLVTSTDAPSDVLVVTPMETEKTHSGIVALINAPSKDKFQYEKTDDEGSVRLPKSKFNNVVDFEEEEEALAAKMEINKITDDSQRDPVLPKNSTNKIVHNATNTTDSEYDKETPTHGRIENSTLSTYDDSLTSNNKSLDQNTSISQAHNMSVISTDQSSTSHSTSQTNSDARTAGFTAPKSKPSVFSCQNKKRGKHSDDNDCRKFYICLGSNKVVSGSCPVNTVFSEINKQCTKNLSHCIRNNQFRCVTEGRFSDFLNDNVYYLCVKNNVSHFMRFKLLCQNGYRLDKTSVRCVLNTESTSTSDMSKSVSEQSQSSNKQIEDQEPENDFSCEEVGNFPDPMNCRSYYVCIKNNRSSFRRRKKKCDSDEIFHKDKKKCVDADSYDC